MKRIPRWSCPCCSWSTVFEHRKLNHEGYHKLDGSMNDDGTPRVEKEGPDNRREEEL